MNPVGANILVVEDDRDLACLLDDELSTQANNVALASSVAEARDKIATAPPDLVVSDLRLPDGDGASLLGLDLPEPRPAFIIITAFGSVQQAVAALKQGADDFLTKPLDVEHLCLTVQRVLQNRALRAEITRLHQGESFHGIIGNSEAMQQLYHQARMIAHANGAVLLTGESGTGKEMVARAIHSESDRAGGPFVAVNCAGVPPDLLEAEFFGHSAGAFTSAAHARPGLFAEADGGTLLLDEIAEMPQSLQAKLLRVLQDGRVRPVGRDTETSVDVRVIAATNQNLQALIDSGAFREDLYYRLETFSIQLPPLRQRGDDIELLAARFLQRFAISHNRQVEGFSEEALGRLRAYAFPGNVRELENAIERAVTFCGEKLVGVEHLPERIRQADAGSPASDEEVLETLTAGEPMLPTLEQLQRSYIKHVLMRVGGNKRRAAALLGIGRRTLYRWL